MKKIYYTFLTAAALLSATVDTLAQECLTAGFCAVSTSQYPSTTQSTTSSAFVPIATDMYAGEFSLCSVTSGVTYQWSLCSSDGGDAPYDSQLTLRHGTTNAALCYSDDFCANDAKIGWTATFTGTVKIQVNEYNCASNLTPTTLVWRTVASGPDAGVATVYTMGKISTGHSNPHVVTARISNGGTTNFTNLAVTLNVTGANSFTNTQTIPSLAMGASTIVTFPGFTSTNTGTNNITVSVPADPNPANNTLTLTQLVTSNTLGYAHGTTMAGGFGFTGGVGEVVAKFNSTTAGSLTSANLFFNAAGASFRVKVRDASGAGGTPGTVLYTSPTITSVTGLNTVTFSPAVTVPTTYYIGVEQLTTTNMGLAYQDEAPLRAQTFYYTTNLTTPAWTDISPAPAFRPMVEVVYGCALPGTPGTITGTASVCAGSTANYSVPAVTGATSYNWTLPSGWSGTSATNSITATAGAFGGTISVTAVNSCGTSSPSTFTVTSSSTPAQPSAISGNSSVCQGSSNTYSVPAVTGATSYNWTLPSGWSGTSAGPSITVTAGATGGNISVTATNSCGTSAAQTMAVTMTAGTPAQPAAITGSPTVCSGSTATFTVPAVTGATSYNWTLPSGWSGSSTTNSITATAGASGGTISVTAVNSCGASPAQNFAVTTSPLPAQPAAISGSNSICDGSSNTYTVPVVPGATSYNWTLPSGWFGTSTTNSITTTAGATSGSIMVAAVNACGQGSAATMAVTVTATPAQPSAITGNNSVCPGASATYSVPAVPGATSYNWTLPSGWSGTSVGPGITVTAGASGGTISVAATNSCGSSTTQTMAVTVTGGAPAQPSAITGSTTVCPGSTATFTVPAVTGATSYNWTLPSGWSGTSTTNSITATAGATGGTVSVTASNTCGASTAQTLAVTIGGPAQPAAIAGSASVCIGSTATFTVPAVTGATSYSWTLPSGWSGTSTTNSITATPGTTGGTISVTASDGACTSPAQTMSVVVNALPPTPIITPNGNIFASSALSGNQWSLNGTIIPGATAQYYTATASGFYTVTVTDANGCSSTSAALNYVHVGLDGASLRKLSLNVYPNPAHGQVQISADGIDHDAVLEISNMLGASVMRVAVSSDNGRVEQTLQIGSLSSGVYLLTLRGKEETAIRRLVVE